MTNLNPRNSGTKALKAKLRMPPLMIRNRSSEDAKVQRRATEMSAALRRVARDERLKASLLSSRSAYRFLLRAARRFIGGENLAECIAVATSLTRMGNLTSVDYMGESIRDKEQARRATAEFGRVIRSVSDKKLKSSVSLDLSHIGLAIDEGVTLRNATILARAAKKHGLEVMINMEGAERTADIFRVYCLLSEEFDNVGVTVQAYLHRTPQDLETVLLTGGKIRLVKGAYEEPRSIAVPRESPELSRLYLAYLKNIIRKSHPVSVATHDPQILGEVARLYKGERTGASLEIEMNYGICEERLRTMRDHGFRTRVYLPYGREWYLYLCHRIAEYPPNVFQAVSDALSVNHPR